jgi:hypothetical protein
MSSASTTSRPTNSRNSACSDRVTDPSTRSAKSGERGSGSCSTMLARM